MGISLEVFDSCEDSTFEDAPIVNSHNECYYPGQGDLVIEAIYYDSVSKTTGKSCGPYTVTALLNSTNSIIDGTPLLGSLPMLAAPKDEKHFKFTLN